MVTRPCGLPAALSTSQRTCSVFGEGCGAGAADPAPQQRVGQAEKSVALGRRQSPPPSITQRREAAPKSLRCAPPTDQGVSEGDGTLRGSAAQSTPCSCRWQVPFPAVEPQAMSSQTWHFELAPRRAQTCPKLWRLDAVRGFTARPTPSRTAYAKGQRGSNTDSHQCLVVHGRTIRTAAAQCPNSAATSAKGARLIAGNGQRSGR